MRWLLTYADLITLMMVFFVIMYAMSKVDQQKFATLAGSLSSAFNQAAGGSLLPMPGAGAGFGGMADSLEQAGQDIAAEVKDLVDSGQVRVMENERGIIISMEGTVLFDTGSATVRGESKQVLQVVAKAIKGLSNYVQVEGYTDDRPINSAAFPTNWELSTRRASNVVRYFTEEQGLPAERFAAAGYGEFRPLYDNTTEAGRAKNRRVDIIILRTAPTLNLGKDLSGEPSIQNSTTTTP
ncbi:MAG: OmpA family protein [Symbiobacteriia bacterium]